MRFSILTLNPGFFRGATDEGMIRIARQKGLLDVVVVPIRDFTVDRYGTTDDYPYGGGAGMVMKAEPILRAFESVRRDGGAGAPRVLVTSPQGRRFDQAFARELCAAPSIVVLCEPPPLRRGHRSEEHTSELQSLRHLVCRLLLE